MPNRQGGIERQNGGGLRERDDDRAGVGRGEAHRGGIGELAGVEGVGVFDDGKEVGVGVGDGWREGTPPRAHKIVGRKRIAIGPEESRAEMKRPGQAVGRGLPALGGGGDGEGGLLIVGREPLKECDLHELLREEETGVRIEVSGFGAGADEEGLGADAFLHGRLAFGAAGEEGGRDKE